MLFLLRWWSWFLFTERFICYCILSSRYYPYIYTYLPQCFPVNFVKFLITHFLQNASGGSFSIFYNDEILQSHSLTNEDQNNVQTIWQTSQIIYISFWVLGKMSPGYMPLQNCPLENCSSENCPLGNLPSPENCRPEKLPPGKLPLIKFFCYFFFISNIYFYENFRP